MIKQPYLLSLTLGFSLLIPNFQERIEWLAVQATLFQEGARFEVPPSMIDKNAGVLESWQRDPSLLATHHQGLIRYDNDQGFFNDIWREFSLYELWLLSSVVYNLDEKYATIPDAECIYLARELAAWLHRQKKWVAAEPGYRANQLLVISWRGLREFLENHNNPSSGQQIFHKELAKYDADLIALEKLGKSFLMDSIYKGSRSHCIEEYRQEQRALHVLFNQLIDKSTSIHPFLQKEIYLLKVHEAFCFWLREKLGMKGITENERLTYYDLPQELSEKAIQKLASPRIMAIRPGGKILIRHVAAVPKSLRHIITLPIIDAWIQEFAAHMDIRQNRSGRQVCPN